jgi:Dyp-type peroxidase family
MGTPGIGQRDRGSYDDPLRFSETIQGNILAPFNKPHQTFLFLNFNNDQDGARRWVTALADNRIATTKAVAEHNLERKARKAEGGTEHPEQIWMGVSLTSSALVTLHPELAADLVAYDAFWRGPLGAGRDEHGNLTPSPALLGNEDDSDPRDWVIGGPNQAPVDALVTIAADDPNELRERADAERRLARELGLTVLEVRQRDGSRPREQRGDTLGDPRRGTEHFGFKGGVSQPGVRGFTSAAIRHGRWESKDQPGTQIIATGEFVLGYAGERGSYPRARPLDPPSWMRDGSFQVFLRLTQDVVGWQDQMDRLGSALSKDVAAKAIGRRPDGTPLAPVAGGQGLNDFNYDDDPHGYHTPRFAHIRKANPRNDAVFQDRTHRLLRRSIPFGPPFEKDQAEARDEDVERGLLFNAFIASIEDQFEFVQRNWASSARSLPVRPDPDGAESATAAADGPDPLIGASPHPCVLQREGEKPLRLDLRRFVRTTGAVYAFAPSIPTLRRLGRAESLRDG